MIHELAALTAAALWSAAIISTTLLSAGCTFQRVSLGMVFFMLLLGASLTGGFNEVLWAHADVLLLSGWSEYQATRSCSLASPTGRAEIMLFAQRTDGGADWLDFPGRGVGPAAWFGIALVGCRPGGHAGAPGRGNAFAGTTTAASGSVLFCAGRGLSGLLVISRPAMEAGVDPIAVSVLQWGWRFSVCWRLISTTSTPAVASCALLAVDHSSQWILGMGVGMT